MEKIVVSLADLKEELIKISILKDFFTLKYEEIDMKLDNLSSYIGWEFDNNDSASLVIKTQTKSYILPTCGDRVTMAKDSFDFFNECKTESSILINILTQYLNRTRLIIHDIDH